MRLSDRFGRVFERLFIRTGYDAVSMRRLMARRGDTAPPARASRFPRMWSRFNYRERRQRWVETGRR